MRTFSRALDTVARILSWIGFAATALMMLHVTADVAAKLLLHAPLEGTLETVSQYYMVAVVFFPLAAVQRDREQVFIELFTHNLPARTRAAMDAAVLFLSFILVGVLFWTALRVAVHKTAVGEISTNIALEYVIWPGRWFPVIGFAATALFCLLQSLEEATVAIARAPADSTQASNGD